jgi:AcrR family transcriptional regulator
MADNEISTLDAILSAAKKEFSEKGFQSASLRKIVKDAGVTTGAFYGYYKSKEELFDALVGEYYDTILAMFKKVQGDFQKLSPKEQREKMENEAGSGMCEMLDYCYAGKEKFKLILCSSEGTKYENLIHEMVEIEVDATHKFAYTMQKLGYPEYEIDPTLEHMLVSGLFSAFFEVIIHDIPYEDAVKYTEELRAFYSAGWKKNYGVLTPDFLGYRLASSNYNTDIGKVKQLFFII